MMTMKTILMASVLAVATGGAWANEAPAPRPHRINMRMELHGFDGKPLKDSAQVTPDDPRCDKCGPLTLGHAIATALVASVNAPDAKQMTWEQKWARGELARRLYGADDAVLASEEVTAIKRALADVYNPVVLAQVMQIIAPDETPPKVQ